MEAAADGSKSPYVPPTNTELGQAVGINSNGFIYVGTPMFNRNFQQQFSQGGIHVGLWCPANKYIFNTGDPRRGVICQACPGTATSQGGQTLSCTGCTGVPATLPSDARLVGCSVK